MNYYILGDGNFTNEITEQVFFQNDTNKILKGSVILENDKAFLISEEGINPFTYPKEAAFIIAIGDIKWRTKFISHFLKYYPKIEKHFPNIIVDSAYISKTAMMGIGNIFCPFSILNGNAIIGDFNLLNIRSDVNHDCVVGDNNILSPGASVLGNCNIRNNNFLSTNVVITPTISMQDNNTISAAECVFEDMSSNEFFQSGIVSKKR